MKADSTHKSPSADLHDTGAGDVFLSYAREDQPTVKRIHDALAQRGRKSWVDIDDIPPADAWLQTIREGIDRSHAFIFILSPDSLTSKVCLSEELRRAIDARKKIIPVVVRDFDQNLAPPEISRLNYIFLRDGDDFEAGMTRLTEALDTDLDHVRRHTQFLRSARLWEGEKRSKSRLLRGVPLQAAETWLTGIGDKEPRAAQLQIDFIRASRTAARGRRRRNVALALVAVLGVALLGLVWLISRGQAALAHQNLALHHLSKSEFPQTQMFADKGLQLIPPVAKIRFWNQARVDAARRQEKVLKGLERLAVGNTGKPLSPLPVWCSPVEKDAPALTSAVFAPDNSWIAAGAVDGRVRVWDWRGNERDLRPSGEFSGKITDLALSADGRRFAAVCDGSGDDDFVQIWRASPVSAKIPDFSEEGRLPHPKAAELAWFPDSTRLVSCGPRSLQVWDGVDDVEPDSIQIPPENSPYDAKVSPNGKFIALACMKKVFLADTTTLELTTIRKFTDETQFSAIDISHDSKRIAAVTSDRGINVWERDGNTEKFRHLGEKPGHDFSVLACRFSPDGEFLATASMGGRIRLWRPNNLLELPLEASLLGDSHHTSYPRVEAVAFSGDSDFLLSIQKNGSARLWFLGRVESQILPGEGNVEGLDFHAATGLLLSGRTGAEGEPSVTGTLRGQKIGAEPPTWENAAFPVRKRDGFGFALRLTTKFTPDGKNAFVFRSSVESANPDPCLFLLDAKTGQIRAQTTPIDPSGAPIQPTCAGFSADARTVVFADKKARCFVAKLDPASGQLPDKVAEIDGTNANLQNPTAWAVALSADGQRGAVIGENGRQSFVRLFDVESHATLHAFNLGERAATGALFHPSGTHLAIGQFRDYSIHVVNFETGETERKIMGHERGITALAFNEDGTRLASGSLNRIRIWDWATGGEIRSIWAHENTVQALAWVGEDELVSGAEDGRLKHWSLGNFAPNWAAYAEKGWLHFDGEDQLHWNPDITKIQPGFVNLPPESSIGRLRN